VLVQQCGAGLAAQRPAGPGGLVLFRVGQRRVEAEQRGHMVRFGRYGHPQRPPEASDPVGGLAAEHALGAHVDRGVRHELQDERLGPVRAAGPGQAGQLG
jgi:hypothetical protein